MIVSGSRGKSAGVDRGAALLIVLWLVVILSVIAMHLAQMMHYEARAAGYYRDELQARALAEAGLARFMAELKLDTNRFDAYSEAWYRETVTAPEQGAFADSGGFFLEPLEVEQLDTRGAVAGTYTLRVSDETGKFSIAGSLSAGEKGKVLVDIISAAGAENSQEISDSILDWIDGNDLHRLNGAEGEDYYLRLPSPYECKNAALDTVDELLLVRGVTPELMRESGDLPGLRDLLTVYTRGEINVNTVSRELLEVLLGPGSEHLAGAVIDRRAGLDGIDGTADDEPYERTGDVWRTPGLSEARTSQPMLRQLSVRSTFLSVEATGAVRQGRTARRIRVVIAKTGKDPRIVYWREG